MVPLDEKITIEETLKKSPKAFALLCFLTRKPIQVPGSDVAETDRIYYSVLSVLHKKDAKSFGKYYSELSERQVLREQPIIYDNFLLFALIIGISKYELSSDWIRAVLSLRDTKNNPEKLITTSFLNLLNKNYLTTEGISSLTLSTLLNTDEAVINSTIVKNSLESNEGIRQYLERDMFLSVIYLSAEHYIVSTSIEDSIIKLRKFEAIFLKRILLLQNVLYVSILIGLILLWLYLIKKFPQIKELANDIGVLLQLVGIGLFAFFLNKIKSKFGDLLRIFFGYKN